MKFITFFVMLMMSLSSMATNKIYVTQAGASLVFDVLQDGDGNMIGNSTTASTASGSATNFNIDQVGDSNISLLIFMVIVLLACGVQLVTATTLISIVILLMLLQDVIVLTL